MDLTKGKISSVLLKFTLPIILMQILNQAYMVVDSIVVARFVSDTALSVWSSANNILLIGYAILNGFNGASHIVVGRYFGEKKYDELKPVLFTLAIGALILSLIVTGAYICFSKSVFIAMQLPDEILSECTRVAIIYALSLPLTAIQGVTGAIINGSGNSKTQTVICVSTQIMNIVLDVVIISCFHMGVEGAALASDFSMFVSCVWTFICARHILKQKTQARMYFFPPALKKYLTLAIPSIIQSSVLSIGTMALQVIVNKAGIAYINGYTAANTIFNLFLLPIVAISTGFETFASQNIGASITERVRGGYHFLMKEGVLICVALSVLDVLLAGKFISIYAIYPGTESFSFARVYLYLMIPNFFLQLFKYSIESLFKAHLKMNLFAASSILSLGCRIAFAFIFTPMIGLSAMAWALLFGSAVSVIFDMCWKHYLKL